MTIYRDYRNVPPPARGAVVAIGNFDGVHRGHQAVIHHVTATAKRLGLPASVLTFEPHPRRFFAPGKPVIRLLPFHHKARLLQHAGIDHIYAQRFHRDFSALGAEEFVQKVLIDGLLVKHLITGEEFVFGAQRKGNAMLLREFAARGAFTYEAISPLMNGPEKCSSTHVREHIARGEMDIAATMLGRPYHWIGRVIRGDARGRQIGFPTLNIQPPPVLMPRTGVYAVRCSLWGKPRLYDGVANLGTRPTFNGTGLRLEIHLLDQEIDWYGQRIGVDFLAHIRDEQRFDGVASLQTRITQDCGIARQILSRAAPYVPWHAEPSR